MLLLDLTNQTQLHSDMGGGGGGMKRASGPRICSHKVTWAVGSLVQSLTRAPLVIGKHLSELVCFLNRLYSCERFWIHHEMEQKYRVPTYPSPHAHGILSSAAKICQFTPPCRPAPQPLL